MRGYNYGSFTGRYGESVQLEGSSSATEAQVWLRINSAKNKNDFMAGEREEACALLTLQQAIVLRAALDSFIEAASDDE